MCTVQPPLDPPLPYQHPPVSALHQFGLSVVLTLTSILHQTSLKASNINIRIPAVSAQHCLLGKESATPTQP